MKHTSLSKDPYYCTACGCMPHIETNGHDGVTIIRCQNPGCSNYYNECVAEDYQTAVEYWNIRQGVR